VFDPVHCPPAVSSTKPVTGHAFGAAPALEAILAIQSLRAQQAPPIWTCRDPDPELRLDLILNQPRALRTQAVLSTSLGFWGNAAALVFRSA
jgi:3-oxoacyl-(acyl-carrier-protein) synthase